VGEWNFTNSSYSWKGAVRWTEQLGTSDKDYGRSVAVDSSGNAYMCGQTYGSLGGAHVGKGDAFLAKYDPVGDLLWVEQVGTYGMEYCNSVAVDALGNAYISGTTEGSLGGANAGNTDAFLAKYDPAGDLLWTEQLGTGAYDGSLSLAVDAVGSRYISGVTDGSLGDTNAGDRDAFLAKYDTAGDLLWTRQLGTSEPDFCHSVAIDSYGNAFINGYTYGSLGETNLGREDAFLAKYDPVGNLLWIEQLGTSADDCSFSVAVDGFDNVFIGGRTGGSLGGPNSGHNDAFLVKFVIPEPCTLALLALGSLALWRRRG